MKKNELVYREILYQAIERKNRRLSQMYLSKELKMSLSTVNLSLKQLRKMNSVEVKARGFVVKDARKILYYWASERELEKDIVYKTRVEKPVRRIESEMPPGTIFTSFSGYKYTFKDVPADYSEVYVYGDEKEMRKRFPANNKTPNLFVLSKDSIIDRYGKKATVAQIFVDLWNQKEWYAKDFLKALEARLSGILE